MDDIINRLGRININENKLKMVDLYAGTGGFSVAFESTDRVQTVFANDYFKKSQQIFNTNFGIEMCGKDLNDINVETEIPEMDILTGGFNCQPFSAEGLQKGFDDERTKSFTKILEIMKCHLPRFVVLENVKHLKFHDEGKSFRKVKDDLRNAGYKIKYKLMNTCTMTDIPQNRERIYIVCFRKKRDYVNFKFPKRVEGVKNLNAFLEDDVDVKYYYGTTYKHHDTWSKHIIDPNVFYRNRSGIRRLVTGYCPTLKTPSSSVPLILDKGRIRRLTPRECFNLQGFPKDYNLTNISDTALYKLVGNAISVPVVKRIADEILRVVDANA